MNRFLFVSYFTVITLASCCAGSKSTPPLQKTPPPPSTFTSKDATTALVSFNHTFYNKEAHLYYSTTQQTELGAIWTQAIFWNIIMDAYERTEDSDYLAMINDIYKGGEQEYDNYNWNNEDVWFIYDDMMWWVKALARAYQITGNEEYLKTSIAGFKRVWGGSYDPEAGGMFWNFDHSGKNACINYPTVITAMKLYNITGDSAYFSKAKKVYTWSHSNLFDPETGRVADHKVGDNPPGFEDYTYNQGTCTGAAVMLYKATHDESYLEDAKAAADYTQGNMCNTDGILPPEGDWNEQGVLKVIFAHYMAMLIKDGNQDKYIPWLQKNASMAWANRDRSRNLTYRDYTIHCPSGEIQSYEASSAVELMQVIPPEQ